MTGVVRVGPENGRVVLRTGRAGLAAGMGHDLTIEATRWAADITVEPAAVEVRVELDSLTVREGSGGTVPLTDRDRADIGRTMRRLLGPGTATFRSNRVVRDGDGGTVEGSLTLRGVTRPLTLTVRQRDSRYEGHATVVQSAYGITPYRALLGALRLRDAVTVEFEVDVP